MSAVIPLHWFLRAVIRMAAASHVMITSPWWGRAETAQGRHARLMFARPAWDEGRHVTLREGS
jgi:hypothetical protein